MSDSRIGKAVKVTNPKHKHFNQIGVVTELDRGNVEVTFPNFMKTVTRWTSLKEIK